MRSSTLTFGVGRALVVAEIGVNHDGCMERAVQLVDAAKRAGADAIKLQVFDAHQLMHPSCRFAAYQEGRTEQADPIAMLQQYALSDADLRCVADHARRVGLLVIATPFSPSDVARVVALQCDAIKIASPDLVNPPLLRTAAAAELPLILSSGASTLSEIETAVSSLRGHSRPVCLLHCISSYPTAPAEANLAWISSLAQQFAVPVGYSDHAVELMAGALAVAAGACVIEKHLTYDRDAQGPDHSASFDEAQFAQYVAMIRTAETLRGGGRRRVLACEEDVRGVSRQSLVAAHSIRASETIRPEMLTVQRPGTGLPAAKVDAVIGQVAACDILAGTMIEPQMIRGLSHAA
jgi:sialic acid synthase SpsE